MDRRKQLVFYACVVGWGLLVAAFVVYLFFPYQTALKVALRSVLGEGRTSVSMQGVTTGPMGIKASKIVLRPEGPAGRAAPLELSDVDIFWNPLSLLSGRLSIRSKAALYGGTVRCAVEGAAVMGASIPDVSLVLDHVDLAKCPQGLLPWLKGITGVMDAVVKRRGAGGKTDRQVGSFSLTLKGGEIRDLRMPNMPRLIIPYKEIAVEGRIDGSRLNIGKVSVRSDLVSLSGAGFVESGDPDGAIDMRLSYEVLSHALPIQGKGVITISGSQAAPSVSLAATPPQRPAAAPGAPGSR